MLMVFMTTLSSLLTSNLSSGHSLEIPQNSVPSTKRTFWLMPRITVTTGSGTDHARPSNQMIASTENCQQFRKTFVKIYILS